MEKKSNSSVKRTRASGPKVRTGCLTCKVRHVKCDEGRPECIRCMSTGRQCDGYKSLAQSDRLLTSLTDISSLEDLSPSIPQQQLQIFVDRSPKERRAIEFFCVRSAPLLAGHFHQEFWRNSVLQISMEEPTIRDAMVTVSTMYENYCFAGKSPWAGTDDLKNLSLQSYNRAIRSLRKKLPDVESVRVQAMACAMFVCVEFLRGDISQALTHLIGGINLIERWRNRNKNPSNRHQLSSPEADDVEGTIAPMFSWLNTVAISYWVPGQMVPEIPLNPTEVKSRTAVYENLKHASLFLLDHLNYAMDFVRHTQEKRYQPEISTDLVSEQRVVITALNFWNLKFKDLVDREQKTWDPATCRGADQLKAIWIATYARVGGCLSPNETVWDSYKSEFEEIIRLSEPLVAESSRDSNEMSKLFCFELSVLPPLYFVSGKCRWPWIRRKALSLLFAARRIECLFDSAQCFALHERLMTLEEEAMGILPGDMPAEDQLPPESGRIHQFNVLRSMPTAEGSKVAYLSKPWGIAGEWHSHTEVVKLVNVCPPKTVHTYP